MDFDEYFETGEWTMTADLFFAVAARGSLTSWCILTVC
jgi:hypothetical protein